MDLIKKYILGPWYMLLINIGAIRYASVSAFNTAFTVVKVSFIIKNPIHFLRAPVISARVFVERYRMIIDNRLMYD